MGIFGRKKREARAIEGVPQSDPRLLDLFGIVSPSASGITVTNDNALGVPAVWAAVQFLSGTLAGLPLHVYKTSKGERVRVKTGIASLLSGAVNDGMSSFEWRKYGFERLFTGGRFVSYIERNKAGRIVNIYPIDPSTLTVVSKGGRKTYEVKGSGQRKAIVYDSTEVIDLPFMLKADGVGHYGPIATSKDVIGLAIASMRYGADVFKNGGVPPLSLQGPFQSGVGAQRAADDVAKAIATAKEEGRKVLAMPAGHELKQIGFKANEMQLVELQRFIIEQIARIYSIPPIFLQDLTNGTFSNSEQQDLHFVKHTIKRWVEQAEQEMNLKLFGRNSKMFVKFNVDGLLRGDFKTRMEAHAASIQNGIRTPNEVRDLENLPSMDEGGQLMIQGATVPISVQSDPKNGE